MPPIPRMQRQIENRVAEPVRISGETSQPTIDDRPVNTSLETARSIMEKEKKRFDTAVVNEYQLEVDSLRNRVFSAVRNMKGKNAAYAQDIAQEEWNKGLKEIKKKGLFTADQRFAADEIDKGRFSDLVDRVNAHSSEEIYKYEVEMGAKALENAAASAGQVATQEQFNSVLAEINKKSDEYADLVGADREVARSGALAGAMGYYIQSALDRKDPIEAARMLNEGVSGLSDADREKLEKTYAKTVRDEVVNVTAGRIADKMFQENVLNEGMDIGTVTDNIMSDEQIPLEIREASVKQLHAMVAQKQWADKNAGLDAQAELEQTRDGKAGNYEAAMRNNPSIAARMTERQKAEVLKRDVIATVRRNLRAERVGQQARRGWALKDLERQTEQLQQANAVDLLRTMETASAEDVADNSDAWRTEIEKVSGPMARKLLLDAWYGAQKTRQSGRGAVGKKGIASKVSDALKTIRQRRTESAQPLDNILEQAKGETDSAFAERNRTTWRWIEEQAELQVIANVAEAGGEVPDRRALIKQLQDNIKFLRSPRGSTGVPEWKIRLGADGLAEGSVEIDGATEKKQSYRDLNMAMELLGGKQITEDKDKMGNLYATYMLAIRPDVLAKEERTGMTQLPPGVDPSMTVDALALSLNKHLPWGVTPKEVDEIIRAKNAIPMKMTDPEALPYLRRYLSPKTLQLIQDQQEMVRQQAEAKREQKEIVLRQQVRYTGIR